MWAYTRFLLAGDLISNLNIADSGGNVTIGPDPDTRADMLERLSAASNDDIGINLANIIIIGNEFLAFTGVVDANPNIQLTGVFRGLANITPKNFLYFLKTKAKLLSKRRKKKK